MCRTAVIRKARFNVSLFVREKHKMNKRPSELVYRAHLH